VPRIISAALRALGVPDGAISVIPDEQEAIEAALRMGQAGDLLLVFSDALVRSWKQITKFKPEGAPVPQPAAAGAGDSAGRADEGFEPATRVSPAFAAPGAAKPGEGAEPAPTLDLGSLIRDERGVRVAPEADD